MGARVRDHRGNGEDTEPGYSSLTRRERLERIASAERDRRAGRREVAVAAIGEPVEWPARAVLALASLADSARETRRLLEEGLDLWARNAGLGELDRLPEDASETPDAATDPMAEPDPLGFDLATHPLGPELEAPLGRDELDRAFDEAEAEVDSMHSVNDVAERVLLDEPIGFVDLSGDELTPVDEDSDHEVEVAPDLLGMDAAHVAPAHERNRAPEDARKTTHAGESMGRSGEGRSIVLATLESWLQNLERRKLKSRTAGRAQ